jgi:ferric-dicitrate binding protein FerR (iron transport regulator)
MRAEFCRIPTEFNEFLFATIGVEGTGVELTVFSALTRLGVDPWKESARLSDLPKRSAAAALSDLVAQLPRGNWEAWQISAIAMRLADLLPAPSAAAQMSPRAAAKKDRRRRMAAWAVCIALAAAALFGIFGAVTEHVRVSMPDDVTQHQSTAAQPLAEGSKR